MDRASLYRIYFLIVVLLGAFTFNSASRADLIVFHNGDYRYGQIRELNDGTVILKIGDQEKDYKRSQIKTLSYGTNPPAAGEILAVTDFNQIGGADILSVTGPITRRAEVKTQSGRLFTLDVENIFEMPIVQFFPARYSFFQRQGCFMAGLLINSSTQTYNTLEMRAHLFDGENRILTSKDFYIYHIPGLTEKGPGQRKFEINFPDVPYDRVARMRLVRKF